jgi:hypothetical protein
MTIDFEKKTSYQKLRDKSRAYFQALLEAEKAAGNRYHFEDFASPADALRAFIVANGGLDTDLYYFATGDGDCNRWYLFRFGSDCSEPVTRAAWLEKKSSESFYEMDPRRLIACVTSAVKEPR